MGMFSLFRTGISYIPVIGKPASDALGGVKTVYDKFNVKKKKGGGYDVQIDIPPPRPPIDSAVEPIPGTNAPGDNVLRGGVLEGGVNIAGKKIPYAILGGGALLALMAMRERKK